MKSLFRLSLTNGVIVGIVFSVITALAYLLNIGIMWFILVMIIELLIIIFAIIYTIRKVREETDDKSLKFGYRFLTGLIVGVVSTWVSGLFSYLLFQVIDPNHMPNLAEGFAESLMDFGVPEEDAYKSVDDMKKGFEPVEQLKSNLINMPAFYIVISLIVSAFMKTKKTQDIVTN
jgi:Na+/H+-dicarboxylate symporter